MRNSQSPSSYEKNAYTQLKENGCVVLKASGSSMLPVFKSKTLFFCKHDQKISYGDLAVIYHRNNIFIHRLVFKGKCFSITWGDNIIFPHIHASRSIIGKAFPIKKKFVYNIPGWIILLISPFMKLCIQGYLFVRSLF